MRPPQISFFFEGAEIRADRCAADSELPAHLLNAHAFFLIQKTDDFVASLLGKQSVFHATIIGGDNRQINKHKIK